MATLLPSWPETPLDESQQQFAGAMPWLEALANWGGLALPWRGGIGSPFVQRSVGPAKHIQALDRLMEYLAAKIPRGIERLRGGRPVRIRPGQSTMKSTAETMNDLDWPGRPISIKVRPDVLAPPGQSPVPSGHVRLFRGERNPGSGQQMPGWIQDARRTDPVAMASAEAEGRWFTRDPALADWYVKESAVGPPGARLTFVDVPQDVALKSYVARLPEGNPIRRFSRDVENEYFLPKEWALKRQIVPQENIEGAKTVLHELFHPKMADVAARRPDLVETLGRTGADRLETMLPEIPTAQLKTFFNNMSRGYYSGPDLWEELAVRLMEHNVAKRRLGP